MKVLTVAIQKGGQGKTSLCCHLAFDAYQRLKKRVLVIDLDTQANTTHVLQKHFSGVHASDLFKEDPDSIRKTLLQRQDDTGKDDAPELALLAANLALMDLRQIAYTETAKTLYLGLQNLSDLYDVCLIDTPPSLEEVMMAAALASDFVISPIQMEVFSLMGADMMERIIAQAQELKPELKFLGLLPNLVDGRQPRQLGNLQQLRQHFPDKVVPLTIGLRGSISEALGSQQPVWEIKKTSARAATLEIHAVANYVFKKMGVS